MNALMPTGRPAGRADQNIPPTCTPLPETTTTVVPPSASRPRAGLDQRLGERDREVLLALAKLRLLTGAQLQRLCVADGSPVTRGRRTRALLQRLADLKLVVRLGRRIGGERAGSSGYVYGLSGNGQAALAVTGPMGGRRRRVWEVKPSFMDHLLAVADVYVGLVEADRCGSAELMAFEAEPPCWRRFPGGSGETVVLKPDSFVRLGLGEMERSAFVEVDLGTESAPTIARKCGVFVAYWRSGIEQQRHGVFPSVLWLANSERGANRIAEAIGRLPHDVQHLFELALLGDAVATLTTTARGGRMS
jgi:hypothetical protein